MITVGRGLSGRGNANFSPPPAASKGQLTQVVTARGWSDQVVLVALVSWTFSLRGPPGRLPLAGQRAGGNSSSEEQFERKAVIGLADKKLTIKLKKSKDIAPGPRRVRILPLGPDIAPGPRRMRRIWEAVARAARTTALLPILPALAGRSKQLACREESFE